MLYIVDYKTRRLLYRNARTREYVPGAREGELCYRAFMNRDRPCDFCPMQDYLATGKPVRKEVYNAYWERPHRRWRSVDGRAAGLLRHHPI